MAQHLLHASQVRPGIEHVRGIAVAQLVRREGWIQPAGREIFFQPQLNQARRDFFAFFFRGKKYRLVDRGRLGQALPVLMDCPDGETADRDLPFLFAFAVHVDDVVVRLDFTGQHPADLADA